MNYIDLVKHYDETNYEAAPYKCKMCGLFEIPWEYSICTICGWQDDIVQNNDVDFEGGANDLSFNQYKSVWVKHSAKITNYKVGAKSHFVEELFVAQGGVAEYVNSTTVKEKLAWR